MNKKRLRGIRLYHPKKDGTGSAIRLTVRAANAEENGALFLTMAKQGKEARQNAAPTWESETRETIRLDFSEIGEVMRVLFGETEQIGEGAGITHIKADAKMAKRLYFKHVVEPIAGYVIEMFCENDGRQITHRFTMTPAEALITLEALRGAAQAIAFGDPTASDHESRE